MARRDDFHSLDQTLRNVITRYSQGYTQLCDLFQSYAGSINAHTSEQHSITRQIVTDEHEATRGDSNQQHGQTRDQLSRQFADVNMEVERTKFMDSLDFHRRNERLNNVGEAHRKTFEWLFGGHVTPSSDSERGSVSDSGPELQPDLINESQVEDDWILQELIEEKKESTWDSFSSWLKSDDSLYWIGGKAGAGKSTLMKFLHSNPQTKRLLDREGSRDTLVVSHFFYFMGQPMQHNIKGLLCSLLYQVLQSDLDRAVLSNLIQTFPEVRGKKFDTDWSEKELRSVLFYTLKRVMATWPICVFLDGLDEIVDDGGAHTLLDLIKELQSCGPQTMKLCVSSRREEVFRKRLGSEPQLQLHQLTAPDMYRTALEFLESPTIQLPDESPSEKLWSSRQQNWVRCRAVQALARRVVEKSEGVFLWTHLARRSLQKASTNNDTWDIIQKRLEKMPKELGELYKMMWDRLNEGDEVYRADAAFYFNLVLEWPGEQTRFYLKSVHNSVGSSSFTLGHLSLARDTIQAPRTCRHISDDSFHKTCRLLHDQISIRSAGLLELSPATYMRKLAPGKAAEPPDIEVRFIHRTAREFLVGGEGRSILKWDESSREQRACGMLHAWLCRPLADASHERNSGEACLRSGLLAFNIAHTLRGAQTDLPKATWLKWIEKWESLLYGMPAGCLQKSGIDILSCTAWLGVKDYVVLSFERQALFTSDYKSHILHSAMEQDSEATILDEFNDWLDMLDFLVSEECKPQFGPILFGLAEASPCELFLLGVLNIIESESLLSNEELCDRVVRYLQFLTDNEADLAESFYCVFGRQERHGLWLHTRRGYWHEGKRVLLTWTMQHALFYLERATHGTAFGRRLGEFISSFKGNADLAKPEVILIGEGTKNTWLGHAKTANAAVEERILEIIYNPVPWGAKTYHRSIKTMQDNLDTAIEEALRDGDGPEDLYDYLEMHLDNRDGWRALNVLTELMHLVAQDHDNTIEQLHERFDDTVARVSTDGRYLVSVLSSDAKRRMLEIIMTLIQWAAQGPDQGVKQLEEDLSKAITEDVHGAESPGDLSQYLMSELGLEDLRPYAFVRGGKGTAETLSRAKRDLQRERRDMRCV